jgi:Galactose oxidase, central domain
VVALLAFLFASASDPQTISVAGRWTRWPSANGPTARFAALTANDATGKVLMFGGIEENDILSDTWTWDGAEWE